MDIKNPPRFRVGIAASLSSLSTTKINIIFEFHVIYHKKTPRQDKSAEVLIREGKNVSIWNIIILFLTLY